MEKTYVKNLRIKKYSETKYEALFEISDEVRGFYMPVHLESDTEDGAIKKANKFLGKEAIFLDEQTEVQ